MKIVHMCLGCFFPDNYSYQENMLPKFHKELGYEVEVIASLVTFDKDGKEAFLEKGSIYQNEHNIKVTRLDYKKPEKVYKKLKRYIGTFKSLESAQPDILFIHGCQFMDIDIVVKYVKAHPHVRVYVDNHADFSNSATNWLSKNILHKVIWKHCAQTINPHTSKFYGVLPARVDFLVDVYKLPKEKVELLVMGADDERVQQTAHPQVRRKIRELHGVSEDDFLIVTGGKIDQFKTQTLLLMNSIKEINNSKLKLIVFGSVTPELKKQVNDLVDQHMVQYIGWIEATQSYEYFSAADLVVFPGRHSVFWEQVVGMGVPIVCKYWEGTTHVDVGGNVIFLREDSSQEIEEVIKGIFENNEKYFQMKKNAVGKGMKMFSYKEISKRSIEMM